MNKALESLKKRILDRDYTVGIIGLGFVGLPLALRFGEAKFKVLGFDLDEEKISQLNNGSSYIKYIPGGRVSALIQGKKLEATADFSRLREADALLICVPTPLTKYREPDLQFVTSTADAIAKTLRKGQFISLESTTYPGTTEEVLLPRFTKKGLEVGKDFYLAYCPEREDPGSAGYAKEKIPRVVGGTTQACRDLAQVLYGEVLDSIKMVSSTQVAEATKILENIYRSVNIALVNELKMVFDKMGIDIWEVIEAAKTKPFGFQAFYPGPGLGGHCIPIDPFYLTWKAKEHGLSTRFIELAGEINRGMPAYMVRRLTDVLNSKGQSIHGSRILVLGLSYKKDVDDLRESPALEILEELLSRGARVDYSDPYFAKLPRVRRHDLKMTSVNLSEKTISGYDAVFLATDHSSFPYELIHRAASLIVDSRNAFRQRGFDGERVVTA